jgi:Reverse transcriptase (RNA-dependent DNA polymerase)/Endonuclease-reverse transcriptase
MRKRTEDFDVIGIVESWANKSINDAELTIQGYNMFRLDKEVANGAGGGLLLYVKDKWESTCCEEFSKQKFVQSLWCTVRVRTGKLLVGLCYRSPSSTKENNENLLRLLEGAVQWGGFCNVLIMGDFNYPAIDYQQDTVMTGPGSAAALFLEKTQDLLLFQHVGSPTRVRLGSEPSTLDYIFTDSENLIEDVRYKNPIGKSDHVVLEWDLLIETADVAGKQRKFNYCKGDYAKMTEKLSEVDWKSLFENKSVDQMWSLFKDIVLSLTEQYVPLKEEFKKRKGHWITNATIKVMKQRSRAWKKYRQFQSYTSFEEYRKLRNRVNDMVRADGDAYRKRLLAGFKDRPKRFYGYMRGLQSVKDNISALRRADGTVTGSDKETADELASCFQQMFTKEDIEGRGNQGPATSETPEWQDSDVDFSVQSVLRKLQKINADKAAGPDGVHPMFLKACAASIAEPLSIIFNSSFVSGNIPADWRTASIVPIYKKKGPRADPSNYRPVSLTSVPCKVMESLIKEKLMDFVDRNGILTRHQHGFVQQRSCLTNLLETLEAWTEELDSGYGVDVLFLDYRKAFDSVPHRRLIEKLRNLGIRSNLLRWIESFLTDRTMRVGVRGTFSNWIRVLSGVPQGSVLGPLLFLLFVNDLPDWVVSNLKMFADDTKLWRALKLEGDSRALQEDLDSLSEWSSRWLLKFNPSKCKLMHVGHRMPTEYYMQDDSGSRVKIEEVDEEKDLGVYLKRDLKSSTQCTKAAGKARAVLAMVKRNFKRLDSEDFRLIYKTYIRPHMEYCVQAWSPHLLGDIRSLERVQRSATAMVPALRKLPYEQRLQQLGFTTLERRRCRGDLIEAYKILTGKERVDSQRFFRFSQTGHDLRGHSMKLAVASCHTEVRRHFFSHRVVQHWNGLPQHVVDAQTVNAFKNRLDKHWQDMGI